MDEKNDILKLLGSKGTFAILRCLHEHGTRQYKDLMEFVNIPTLNDRLRRLLQLKLIEHHLERVNTRKEWYSLTEKGKQVLNHLETIVMLIED